MSRKLYEDFIFICISFYDLLYPVILSLKILVSIYYFQGFILLEPEPLLPKELQAGINDLWMVEDAFVGFYVRKGSINP